MHDADLPEGLPDWIREHVVRYRETGGAEGHMWDSSVAGGPGLVPTLLLTTTGRRSGRPRTLPLIYTEADGGYVVIASKGGAPCHPAWYRNLQANPDVDVQVKDRRFHARAREARGEARDCLWRRMVEIFPPYEDYRRRTDREIPVVVLEPVG